MTADKILTKPRIKSINDHDVCYPINFRLTNHCSYPCIGFLHFSSTFIDSSVVVVVVVVDIL